MLTIAITRVFHAAASACCHAPPDTLRSRLIFIDDFALHYLRLADVMLIRYDGRALTPLRYASYAA